ncbi:hypothetical protein KFL_007390075 [Klebsormidium nitens]|uniref:Uncharacterized protein n=1 Tax=Klebsormidium nitens TaxID=105231 RepID=A0A1Y1IK92_KLENI|nr:hypothetical protein KFL_007390075 [Klebsormidium nitens]|eukprot:GAQ91184.1 hypothetical protein KFL_007390075 [Klebsormidium nitens]
MSEKSGAKTNEFAWTKQESQNAAMKAEAAAPGLAKPAAPGLTSVWSGCCPRQRGGGWSTAYLELQKSLIQQGKQS